MDAIGRGSEYIRTGTHYLHTADIHGNPRVVEIRPCRCGGYGCENCDEPGGYVPNGYVPGQD